MTDNTTSVQQAIDHRAVTGESFPSGIFLSGTLYLKVMLPCILLEKLRCWDKLMSATSAPEFRVFPSLVKNGPTGTDILQNAEYVSIEGNGTIDGQGASFCYKDQ